MMYTDPNKENFRGEFQGEYPSYEIPRAAYGNRGGLSKLDEIEEYLLTSRKKSRKRATPSSSPERTGLRSRSPHGAVHNSVANNVTSLNFNANQSSSNLYRTPRGQHPHQQPLYPYQHHSSQLGGYYVPDGGYAADSPYALVPPSPPPPAPTIAQEEQEAALRRYVECLETEITALTEQYGECCSFLAQATFAGDVAELVSREMAARAQIYSEEQQDSQSVLWAFWQITLLRNDGECRQRVAAAQAQATAAEASVRHLETVIARLEREKQAYEAKELSTRQEAEQWRAQVAASLESVFKEENGKLSELLQTVPTQVESAVQKAHGTDPSEPYRKALEEQVQRAIEALAAEREQAEEAARRKKAEESAAAAEAAAAEREARQALFNSATVQLSQAFVEHYSQMVDTFLEAAAAKADYATYEISIVRMVSEKQTTLKWANLYAEKKDEAKNLQEQIFMLRSRSTIASDWQHSRQVSNVSSQYDRYASPYIPAQLQTTTPATRKSISQWRQEALRLGARPAPESVASASNDTYDVAASSPRVAASADAAETAAVRPRFAGIPDPPALSPAAIAAAAAPQHTHTAAHGQDTQRSVSFTSYADDDDSTRLPAAARAAEALRAPPPVVNSIIVRGGSTGLASKSVSPTSAYAAAATAARAGKKTPLSQERSEASPAVETEMTASEERRAATSVDLPSLNHSVTLRTFRKDPDNTSDSDMSSTDSDDDDDSGSPSAPRPSLATEKRAESTKSDAKVAAVAKDSRHPVSTSDDDDDNDRHTASSASTRKTSTTAPPTSKKQHSAFDDSTSSSVEEKEHEESSTSTSSPKTARTTTKTTAAANKGKPRNKFDETDSSSDSDTDRKTKETGKRKDVASATAAGRKSSLNAAGGGAPKRELSAFDADTSDEESEPSGRKSASVKPLGTGFKKSTSISTSLAGSPRGGAGASASGAAASSDAAGPGSPTSRLALSNLDKLLSRKVTPQPSLGGGAGSPRVSGGGGGGTAHARSQSRTSLSVRRSVVVTSSDDDDDDSVSLTLGSSDSDAPSKKNKKKNKTSAKPTLTRRSSFDE